MCIYFNLCAFVKIYVYLNVMCIYVYLCGVILFPVPLFVFMYSCILIYCAERVWLVAVTAQLSQMIKKTPLRFCCAERIISWGSMKLPPNHENDLNQLVLCVMVALRFCFLSF